MIEIGQIIRNKRLANSLDIVSIANILKIKPEYLIAIENGEADSFTAQTYYYGYLKQYLKLMQLDDIALDIDNSTKDKKLAMNIPIIDSLHPSLSFALISLILMMFVYNICGYLATKAIIDPISLEIHKHNSSLADQQ